ncbi:3-oxoacyl-ACP synthase III family protein [Streptomyces sp. NPDC001930]|uniref:3-oxoacyl-ACP synthase III family protein n=1 Tax=Streptomyces sp. NPDC001930 TaxID=3364625 RepID=UPI0036A7BCC9
MSSGAASPVAHLVGAGSALPGAPVDNGTLAGLIGASASWIDDFTGTRTRHFATDLKTGAATHALVDLCHEAAEAAIADAGIEPGEVGFVVLSTATPDHLMPATVNLVADRLGIGHVPTYQLQSGCVGAIQALDLACRILRDPETDGSCATGLVIGADVCNKHLLLDRDFARVPPRELVNYMLFGDGAGAAVVSREPWGHRTAIRRVLNRFVGLGQSPGQVIEWFGLADRLDERPAAQEDYKAIEENVPRLAEEILCELADDLAWDLDRVEYVLPPQLSGRMTELIVDRIALPAREVSCVAATGNNGNALPFLQLGRLLPQLRDGERALCAAVESSKWLKGGLALEKTAIG